VLTIDGARDNWFGPWPPPGLSDESGSLAAMTEPDLRRFLVDNRALTAEQIARQLEAEVRSQPRVALRDDVAFLVLRVASR